MFVFEFDSYPGIPPVACPLPLSHIPHHRYALKEPYSQLNSNRFCGYRCLFLHTQPTQRIPGQTPKRPPSQVCTCMIDICVPNSFFPCVQGRGHALDGRVAVVTKL